MRDIDPARPLFSAAVARHYGDLHGGDVRSESGGSVCSGLGLPQTKNICSVSGSGVQRTTCTSVNSSTSSASVGIPIPVVHVQGSHSARLHTPELVYTSFTTRALERKKGEREKKERRAYMMFSAFLTVEAGLGRLANFRIQNASAARASSSRTSAWEP